MPTPKNRFGYNDYPARKDDETYERPKTSHISPATQAAIEELAGISTWDEFVEVCERQKAKREGPNAHAESIEWFKKHRSLFS